MMMMAKAVLALWANSVLKKHDAVLSKLSTHITYEHNEIA